MSKHTKGPWRAVYFQHTKQWDVDAGGEDDSDRYSVLEDLAEENAHLIAAAPDLLEACKAAFSNIGAPITHYQKEFSMLSAAIAKAEGNVTS